MFKYPESFVAKCKEVYPDWEDLHYQLNLNSRAVGNILERGVGFSLDEEMIISLFRNKKETKILEAAKRAKLKRDLYREWTEVVDTIIEHNGHEV